MKVDGYGKAPTQARGLGTADAPSGYRGRALLRVQGAKSQEAK